MGVERARRTQSEVQNEGCILIYFICCCKNCFPNQKLNLICLLLSMNTNEMHVVMLGAG